MAKREIANSPKDLTVPPTSASAGGDGHSAHLASLIHAAQTLPTPTNYYHGQQPGALPLPTNILAFYRQSRLTSVSCHYRHLLLLNLGQEGTLALDGQVMDMPAGSGILVFPYQHHHYPDHGQSTPRRLFFTFEMQDDTMLAPLRQRTFALPQAAIDHATRLCQRMPQDPQTTLPLADRNEMALELAMLLQVLLKGVEHEEPARRSAPAVTSENRRVIQEVGRYLRQHLNEPVSIDDLADDIDISPSHLRHLFKQEMGVSLGHYIRRSKCIYAASLIDTTNRSMSQIAQACGFTTLSAFSRSFTREMGSSPAAYRQRGQG